MVIIINMCNDDEDVFGASFVSPIGSVFLLFVWVFRPMILPRYSALASQNTPWRSLFLDLMVEDVPSIALNVVIGVEGMAARLALISSIASVLYHIMLIRKDDPQQQKNQLPKTDRKQDVEFDPPPNCSA